jgi:hypothetical protein
MLGGLEWDGLEWVAEILGVEDIERLVRDLITIREHQSRKG